MVDLTGAIGDFFSIFNTVLTWLRNTTFIIGSVEFSLFTLAISIIVLDLIIWFVFRLIG